MTCILSFIFGEGFGYPKRIHSLNIGNVLVDQLGIRKCVSRSGRYQRMCQQIRQVLGYVLVDQVGIRECVSRSDRYQRMCQQIMQVLENVLVDQVGIRECVSRSGRYNCKVAATFIMTTYRAPLCVYSHSCMFRQVIMNGTSRQ